MNCYKLTFNIMASLLIVLGLGLAFLGFYEPSVHKIAKDIEEYAEQTEFWAQSLEVASYGIGVMGLGAVAVAILGLVSVNMDIGLLLMVFRFFLIIGAIMFLGLGGLAMAAVIMEIKAFKDHWRPIMEKYDSSPFKLPVFFRLHILQLKFKCCGLSWEDAYKNRETPPVSCCLDVTAPSDLSGVVTIIVKAVGKKCTKETVRSENRPGCDVAGNETFITLGFTIAGASLFAALYLIALLILTYKGRKRNQ